MVIHDDGPREREVDQFKERPNLPFARRFFRPERRVLLLAEISPSPTFLAPKRLRFVTVRFDKCEKVAVRNLTIAD